VSCETCWLVHLLSLEQGLTTTFSSLPPSLPQTQAKSKTERKEKRKIEAAGLAEKEEEK